MKASIKTLTLLSAALISASVWAESTQMSPTPSTTYNATTNTSTNATPNTSTTTTTNTNMPNQQLTSNSSVDAGLISGVQGKIAQDNLLKDFNISVSSTEGVVTLNGTVNSQAQADAALNAARSVEGVSDVKSNIIVKTPETPSTTTY